MIGQRAAAPTRAAIAFSIAVILGLSTASAASAYTIELNNFDNDGQSGCTNTSPFWCIRWPKSGSASTTVYVILDSDLSTLSMSSGTSMATDIRAAFPRWNGIQGVPNPWLVEGSWSNTQTAYEGVAGSETFAADTYAQTTFVYDANNPHKITHTTTLFNTQILWNHTFDYSWTMVGNVMVFRADSRKVSTHELGHVEGLGHTNHVTVMKRGDVSTYAVGSDEVAGITVCYSLNVGWPSGQ